MISVNEAEKLISKNLPNKIAKSVGLIESHGKILADDVFSPISSPTYTNSAMDGFAVRWEDLSKPDAKLQIIGESCAGAPFYEKLTSGKAIRINTGAMVSDGADTVVPIENCEVECDFVKILSVKNQGQHIRFKGEEFAKGDILLEKNTLIQSQQIGLLASVGVAEISVFVPPIVSIVVTGEELVSFDTPCKSHQLRDSNTPMLRMILQENGIENIATFSVGDSLKDTIAILTKASSESQIIIFSGGVSVGEHDFVKEAAKAVGFTELFWKIRQKPGKPLFFARKDDKLLFGLPGNPVSAFMGFIHFVAPVLRKLQGFQSQKTIRLGKLNRAIENKSDRTQFLRVQFDSETNEVQLPEKQGSHMLTSIAQTNGYIQVEPGQKISEHENINVFEFNLKF